MYNFKLEFSSYETEYSFFTQEEVAFTDEMYLNLPNDEQILLKEFYKHRKKATSSEWLFILCNDAMEEDPEQLTENLVEIGAVKKRQANNEVLYIISKPAAEYIKTKLNTQES